VKRAVGALLLLAFATSPASTQAATNEIRFCGTSSSGWEVTAGNYPAGGIPRTRCSFAWAAWRKLRPRIDRAELYHHFRLSVRGQRLRCSASASSFSYRVQCKNGRRFVLVYMYRQQRRAYWRICAPPQAVVSGTMLTHRVGCARAREVIRRVFVKSQEVQATNRLRVKGFACRLNPYADRAIRCRDRERRILSPLAG
jgi:hypothetical protein